MIRFKLLPAVLGAAAVALSSGLAYAADTKHNAPVKENAADYTPELVPTATVARPRVDAITAEGATAYAGGLFDRVTAGGVAHVRSNLMAFDAGTGSLRSGFAPTFDKPIRAVENAADGGVYVGGDFTTVNGVTRRGLVKLTADGAIDTAFAPPFGSGLIYDVELVGGHLFVAGNAGKKLMSLNPATGKDDGLINKSITGQVCKASGECAWGTTSVYDFSVQGSRLAAVGNFTHVDGQPRSKFFMLDLTPSGSTLNPWYYPGFAKECTSTHPRRIAYLQGIDFNPDGTAFNVAATGQIPQNRPGDIWYNRLGDSNKPNTTVCDALGRFNVHDSTKPAWINYTGGDSMWTVQDTGAAVYVQGHFRWVDNPDGYASKWIGDKAYAGDPAPDPDGTLKTGVRRAGIAAIDPVTGLALSWSPAVPTKVGGKALEATATGLWVGSDSSKFGAETHYGLAFAPL
jgi:hypothetical protein